MSVTHFKKIWSPTKITNPKEESISEKICVSETAMMIDRFIKGLESLNIGPNELNVTHKLNDEPRIELTDRLVRFNEFANSLKCQINSN